MRLLRADAAAVVGSPPVPPLMKGVDVIPEEFQRLVLEALMSIEKGVTVLVVLVVLFMCFWCSGFQLVWK